MCLKILNDNGVQSETGKTVMNKFDEIYIDEYQDCNSVQEAIFSFVSGKNKGKPNVFAVGDMRQKPLRQIVTAVADGAVASKYAEEFIDL